MRVLVTRAAADGERTAAALAERGHTALLAPVLEIRAGSTPLPAGRFAATLATSAHAVAAQTAGIDRLHAYPLFAVGDATARAARQAGFKDVRVSRGDGRDLAALLALTLPRPAGLLYLAGRDRKPATEEALAEAGYAVTAWEAYAAEPAAAWSRTVCEALASGQVEAALHFSQRSAALALALAEVAGPARRRSGPVALLPVGGCRHGAARRGGAAHRGRGPARGVEPPGAARRGRMSEAAPPATIVDVLIPVAVDTAYSYRVPPALRLAPGTWWSCRSARARRSGWYGPPALRRAATTSRASPGRSIGLPCPSRCATSSTGWPNGH